MLGYIKPSLTQLPALAPQLRSSRYRGKTIVDYGCTRTPEAFHGRHANWRKTDLIPGPVVTYRVLNLITIDTSKGMHTLES